MSNVNIATYSNVFINQKEIECDGRKKENYATDYIPVDLCAFLRNPMPSMRVPASRKDRLQTTDCRREDQSSYPSRRVPSRTPKV